MGEAPGRTGGVLDVICGCWGTSTGEATTAVGGGEEADGEAGGEGVVATGVAVELELGEGLGEGEGLELDNEEGVGEGLGDGEGLLLDISIVPWLVVRTYTAAWVPISTIVAAPIITASKPSVSRFFSGEKRSAIPQYCHYN
ncbi:MAG: hypothetical protein WEA04_02050 [Candidatus Andersenbacteria bacterium]